MIDFTLAELLTGLDLEPQAQPVKPVSIPDEASPADEAEAEKPER